MLVSACLKVFVCFVCDSVRGRICGCVLFVCVCFVLFKRHCVVCLGAAV